MSDAQLPHTPSHESDNWQLLTERLLLRQLTVTDAAFVLDLLNSPSWLRFIGDRNVHTPDDARQYIQNGPMVSYRQYGLGTYLTALRETQQPIGTCGLHRRDGLPDIDLGFAFLPGFERQGYGFEAASAVMAHAKTLGLTRLTAFCDPDNQASIQLISKLGFHVEQRIQYHQKESLLYSISL